MADGSPIEWTDATWNPVTGCSVVSPGCTHCYAMKLAGTRLQHHPSRAGLTRASKAGPVWTGEVRLNEEWLTQPLAWSRPRMIFVCAHGDLFHESVPDAWIDRVVAVMALCPQHTFQVLTKRSARMREYMTTPERKRTIAATVMAISERRAREAGTGKARIRLDHFSACFAGDGPFENVWLGVSCEDQRRADERIPDLLATPAALRFASAEPLLGPIDFTRVRWKHPNPPPGPPDPPQVVNVRTGKVSHYSGGRYFYSLQTTARLDWVIVGGESGKAARPMHPDWARAIRDQCAAVGVPFFFKQWGEWIEADQQFARIEQGTAFIARDGARWSPARPLNFADAAFLAEVTGVHYEHHSDGSTMLRLGKARAGRLLDGVTHDAMPEPRR